MTQPSTSISTPRDLTQPPGVGEETATRIMAIVGNFSRFNPHCRAMWLRMKAQKKPTKVILMAIANKLIRQIHALIRTNTPYDPNFLNLALAN